MNKKLIFLLLMATTCVFGDNQLPASVVSYLNNRFPGWQLPKEDPKEKEARLEVLKMVNQDIQSGKKKKGDIARYDQLTAFQTSASGDFNGDGQIDYLFPIVVKTDLKMVVVMGGKQLSEFDLATEKLDRRFDFEVFKKGTSFGNSENFSNDVVFFNTYREDELESSRQCSWANSKFSCEFLSG